MAVNGVNVVSALTKAGFKMACVVRQGDFVCVGASAQNAQPKAWNDSAGNLMNENQELADDWTTIKEKKNGKFCFFGVKWSLVGNVCTKNRLQVKGKGREILIAMEIEKHWFIATCTVKPMMGKKEKGDFKDMNQAMVKFEKALESCDIELDDD